MLGFGIAIDVAVILQQTAGLSNDALAAHVRLCADCWLMDSIPGDLDTLARMARIPRDRFDAVWAEICIYYAPSSLDATRIIHPLVARQKATLEAAYRAGQREVDEREELHRKRQDAGRRSAEARREKYGSARPGSREHPHEQNPEQNANKPEQNANTQPRATAEQKAPLAPVHDAPAAVSQELETQDDLFGYSHPPTSPNGDVSPLPGQKRGGRTLKQRRADGSKMFMPEVPTVELPAELEPEVQLFLASMAEASPRGRITQTRAVITRNELRAILEAVGDPRFLAFAMREALRRDTPSPQYVRSVAANAAQRGLSALPGQFRALPKPAAPNAPAAPRKRIEDMNPREFQEYIASKRAANA